MAYAEKLTLFHGKICCYCDLLEGFWEVGHFYFGIWANFGIGFSECVL